MPEGGDITSAWRVAKRSTITANLIVTNRRLSLAPGNSMVLRKGTLWPHDEKALIKNCPIELFQLLLKSIACCATSKAALELAR